MDMFIRMRQDIFLRVGESGNAPGVCLLGHWVALIFSMFSYKHHMCMCMYILQM